MKTALLFALVLGALFASGKVIITKSDQRVTMACGISAFTKRLEWHRENVLVIETFMRANFPVLGRGQTAIADRSSLVGMSLSVSKVKQEDAGTFTCKADGKSQQHTLVVVSVLVSPSRQVELGSEAKLLCQAAGLPPQGTVQWIRPDESPGPKSQNHTLTSVDRSDAGTWKCKVSHSGEEFTYNLELKITGRTQVFPFIKQLTKKQKKKVDLFLLCRTCSRYNSGSSQKPSRHKQVTLLHLCFARSTSL
ncbi:uncharacterized protein V6R79_015719 [Siganus canaliculatus]